MTICKCTKRQTNRIILGLWLWLHYRFPLQVLQSEANDTNYLIICYLFSMKRVLATYNLTAYNYFVMRNSLLENNLQSGLSCYPEQQERHVAFQFYSKETFELIVAPQSKLHSRSLWQNLNSKPRRNYLLGYVAGYKQTRERIYVLYENWLTGFLIQLQSFVSTR